MEEQVKMAARLYGMRDTAKNLYREKYHEKLEWYIRTLKAFAFETKSEILPAVIDLCSKNPVKESGMAIMMFMAAAVEIIEPSNK